MSDIKYRTIIMKQVDNVASALQEIPKGTQVDVESPDKSVRKITLKEKISFGHKFAVKPIQKGTEVLKYSEVIGRAIRDISEGEHVHVHNLEGIRGRGDKIVTE